MSRWKWLLALGLGSATSVACVVPTTETAAEDVGEVTQAICLTGPAFPTCRGNCGHMACSPAFPEVCCACDEGCEARGDCCCDLDDHCTPEPTCDGFCGGSAPGGCYCDHLCAGYGDCCGDFDSTCNAAVQIDAKHASTCAVNAAGSLRCWGSNTHGQLGYGHTNNIGDDETPMDAGNVNIGAAASYVGVGMFHACALLPWGAVRCWGRNQYGQLGYGHVNDIGDDELPLVSGDVNLGGTVTQLAVGGWHNCALLSTGAVRCWGANYAGQLGYGHTSNIGDNESPASAGTVNVGGTVTQLAAGDAHTCARLSTGKVRCWGAGAFGALGYGNTNTIGDNESPASAGDLDIEYAINVRVGHFHSCALVSPGVTRCWGWNWMGKLGYGHTNNIGDDETAGSVGYVEVGGIVRDYALDRHTCALLSGGHVRCWGNNGNGQLGYGHTMTIGDDELPSSAGSAIVGGPIKQVTTGLIHTCAVLESGGIRCWGASGSGNLGYGNTATIGDDETPASAGDVPVF